MPKAGAKGRKIGRRKKHCLRYKTQMRREKNLLRRLIKRAKGLKLTLIQYLKKLNPKPRGISLDGGIDLGRVKK